MKKLALLLIPVLAVAAAFGCEVMIPPSALLPPVAGSLQLRVTQTSEIAPAGDGAFRIVCGFSHQSFDDPLVFPGMPGASHLHTFFGNGGTNAYSTPESIRTTGDSTCRGGIANRSAYWVPAMLDMSGPSPVPVPVAFIDTYYKNGSLDGSVIQPFPPGLRMIAGDPKRSAPYSPVFSSRFKCLGGPNNENDQYGPNIANCDVGADMVSEVFFPQCWDGKNLDSPDHRSHMSYPVWLQSKVDPSKWLPQCPADHPVAIPQVAYNVSYRVLTKDAPLKWRLSSDMYDATLPGGYSSHGDWFNGWDQSIADTFVKFCIQAKKDCHAHLLGDGRTIY